nr:hypothetical protein [Tanacetum cinerariifolium]
WRTVLPHAGRGRAEQHRNPHRSVRKKWRIVALWPVPGDGQEASVAGAHGGTGSRDL